MNAVTTAKILIRLFALYNIAAGVATILPQLLSNPAIFEYAESYVPHLIRIVFFTFALVFSTLIANLIAQGESPQDTYWSSTLLRVVWKLLALHLIVATGLVGGMMAISNHPSADNLFAPIIVLPILFAITLYLLADPAITYFQNQDRSPSLHDQT